MNARSESGAKVTVNTHKAGVFEENQAGEGCEEQEGQRKLPQPERDRGNSSKRESPGDQVNRHPGLWNQGETTG